MFIALGYYTYISIETITNIGGSKLNESVCDFLSVNSYWWISFFLLYYLMGVGLFLNVFFINATGFPALGTFITIPIMASFFVIGVSEFRTLFTIF